MSDWLAHTENRYGKPDYVHEHLRKVADRAAEYAAAFGASDEARLAGLLHDLGKYGDRFQRRLKGEERHIDHWSLAAYVALDRWKAEGVAAALAVHGHHTGLQSKDSLRDVSPQKLKQAHPLGLRLSEEDPDLLLQRLSEDGLQLPATVSSLYHVREAFAQAAASMLDVRMLFSALVDADFIETEAHFEGRCREKGPLLEPETALAALERYVENLRPTASEEVLSVRDDLRRACLDAAQRSPGLFTLTAPTGAGKTLAMLAFALAHAKEHGLRRIVMVIPYLSIIDQTAKVYREAFKDRPDLDRYVIEHHSMAGTRTEGVREGERGLDNEDEGRRTARLLADNWDAPIIVTTSVQMLESLFANRSGPCRKLHRLAKSVILFDEVQTLPVKLAIPTLATLAHLSSRYGATVVFSTATQPAFRELDAAVRTFAPTGWKPHEIIPDDLRLFERIRRTKAVWPKRDEKMTWGELADRLLSTKDRQALCIVNLRPHARTLYREVKERGVDGLFHLSTSMCPAHRKKVLDEVRRRLEAGEPCLLVSTQCVEAGVDLDFPAVFRALGPLDAIAQAAGRCNRNGKGERGIVTVFVPDEDGQRYPDGAYKQGASVAEWLVAKARGELDINDPSVYERYYYSLYTLRKLKEEGKELTNAIRTQNFAEVAQKYRLIPNDSVNVVVSYDEAMYETLKQEAEEAGLRAKWIRKARPYAVGLFRSKRDEVPYLDPVPIHPGSREKSDEWFVYLNPKDYDEEVGLVLPDPTSLIA